MCLVPRTGVEPVRLAAPDFKSGTSTNFVTRASSGMLARARSTRRELARATCKRNQHGLYEAITADAGQAFVLACGRIDQDPRSSNNGFEGFRSHLRERAPVRGLVHVGKRLRHAVGEGPVVLPDVRLGRGAQDSVGCAAEFRRATGAPAGRSSHAAT